MSGQQSTPAVPLRGKLYRDEPLSRHTSWRVGGVARQFYLPVDADDLAHFLSTLAADEPIYWLGLGSNVLVRDGGFAGTVICLKNGLQHMAMDHDIACFGAGVACAKAARYLARQGWVGMEFLAGIPGTIGGALAMNAGCWQGETWDFVQAVDMVDRQGCSKRYARDAFEVGYRRVECPQQQWFLGGYFKLSAGEPRAALDKIRHLLAKRTATQPTGEHSCGSVFRNPEGHSAGHLIEQCGLKGEQMGGAKVSEKHANFIVNEANASAKEIEQLICHVQQRVQEQTGVVLQTEVVLIGEETKNSG